MAITVLVAAVVSDLDPIVVVLVHFIVTRIKVAFVNLQQEHLNKNVV